MGTKITLGALLLVAVTALVTTEAVSQEGMDEESKKMMEAWAKLNVPGPEHEYLKQFVGNWKTTTTFWMGGPGTAAMTAEGTAECELIFGGRFLASEMKGSLMGQPWESLSLTGYDNFRKKYTQVFLDSSGTAMYQFSGHRTPGGNTIRMYGAMDEPTMGMVAKWARFVTIVKDEDNWVTEGYDLGIGENAKVMEIAYTRAE